MALIEGNLDDIEDKIKDTTTEVLLEFGQKYMQTIGSIQKDLRELHIQASRIQVGIEQASVEQASLAPAKSQAVELVRTVDLRTITFPEESLHTDSADDRIILSTIQNIRHNIVTLSNKTLHTLHTGVEDELRTWEQCAFNLISEYRVNNEQMFTEKTWALKEMETL